VSYNGNDIILLSNDACFRGNERLAFDFTLYCKECECENNLSGRFSAHCEDHIHAVANAKVAVFVKFKYTECQ